MKFPRRQILHLALGATTPTALQQAEIAKWSPIIKEAGIKAN